MVSLTGEHCVCHKREGLYKVGLCSLWYSSLVSAAFTRERDCTKWDCAHFGIYHWWALRSQERRTVKTGTVLTLVSITGECCVHHKGQGLYQLHCLRTATAVLLDTQRCFLFLFFFKSTNPLMHKPLLFSFLFFPQVKAETLAYSTTPLQFYLRHPRQAAASRIQQCPVQLQHSENVLSFVAASQLVDHNLKLCVDFHLPLFSVCLLILCKHRMRLTDFTVFYCDILLLIHAACEHNVI